MVSPDSKVPSLRRGNSAQLPWVLQEGGTLHQPKLHPSSSLAAVTSLQMLAIVAAEMPWRHTPAGDGCTRRCSVCFHILALQAFPQEMLTFQPDPPSVLEGGGQSDRHVLVVPQDHVSLSDSFLWMIRLRKVPVFFRGQAFLQNFLLELCIQSTREIPSGYCTQELTWKQRHGGAYGGDQRSIFSWQKARKIVLHSKTQTERGNNCTL